MKRIVWIFGESATGKKTFIEGVINNSLDILEELDLKDKRIDFVKRTIVKDTSSFNDKKKELKKTDNKKKETLYKKAYRQMQSHCLTKENLQAAKVNGEAQFRSMMRSMGYKHVKIVFE